MIGEVYRKARMLMPRAMRSKPMPRCPQCQGVAPFDRCETCGWCRLEAAQRQDAEGLGDLVPVEPTNP